jgi:hypothetical protein
VGVRELAGVRVDAVTVRVRAGGSAEFVLHGRDGACIVPLRLAPAGFLERLEALPGFDYEPVISVLAPLHQAERVCWHAPAAA